MGFAVEVMVIDNGSKDKTKHIARAHGATVIVQPVKGYGNLFFGQFILLMADETATGVSGCSTDSSVRLIKQIESDLKVQLFDRQSLAFVSKNKVELVPLSQVDYAAENHFIEADTLYFNNTIQTKEELENRWIIPIKESWLSKKIQFKNPVIS